ncbi:uncharacterized protein LOC114165470 [Vigna unguiculata]|uniref:uncharacterized protein LOC114165470 n=1 Tax=Vigna unguiculata TaxID=3917 RepID=UPI0010166A20|nr:uncharacterized protein LOC114165470 [Vigna unguiculata]
MSDTIMLAVGWRFYGAWARFLQQTIEKVRVIQDRMHATQSQQKSYVDKRRRSLEFEAGDHVFLRISRQIGPVAYEIALSPHLANLHNIFHVSQLRKYVADPTHVLKQDDVQVCEDLTMGVEPVKILDSQVKQLKGKEIRTVKVL